MKNIFVRARAEDAPLYQDSPSSLGVAGIPLLKSRQEVELMKLKKETISSDENIEGERQVG